MKQGGETVKMNQEGRSKETKSEKNTRRKTRGKQQLDPAASSPTQTTTEGMANTSESHPVEKSRGSSPPSLSNLAGE